MVSPGKFLDPMRYRIWNTCTGFDASNPTVHLTDATDLKFLKSYSEISSLVMLKL